MKLVLPIESIVTEGKQERSKATLSCKDVLATKLQEQIEWLRRS